MPQLCDQMTNLIDKRHKNQDKNVYSPGLQALFKHKILVNKSKKMYSPVQTNENMTTFA